jgi:hypothetical protein
LLKVYPSRMEGTCTVKATGPRPKIVVSVVGRGVVGHAGARLLADVADASGLTSAVNDALAGVRQRQGGHDPGRVAVDVAVMIADGGVAIADLAVLRDQPGLFGAVASDPTAWRVLSDVDDKALAGLRAARAQARELAWAQAAETRGGFADLEPRDGVGGRAGDFGDELVGVVDAPGTVGFFDVEGLSGVADADVDALSGDDEGAAAADPTLDADWFGCGLGWWSGGAGVAQSGLFGGGERVGQAAQQDAVVDELQQAAVEAAGDPAAGEVVADGVLPTGQPDHANGGGLPEAEQGEPLRGPGGSGYASGRRWDGIGRGRGW